MTPSSRSTGAGGTPPGPARSSRPWNFKVSLSPAPTPPRWCYLTWPGSSSPHALSGPMSPPQAGDPGGWPTLMCQVLTTRARDQGSRPPPSSWPRPWARPPGTGAQLASYAGLAPVTRRCGSSIHGEVRLPRRQQEAQARHVPLRLRLPCAPTPSPGPTTSANATKANHLGPGRPRPSPPPPDTPHRGTVPTTGASVDLTEPPSRTSLTSAVAVYSKVTFRTILQEPKITYQ